MARWKKVCTGTPSSQLALWFLPLSSIPACSYAVSFTWQVEAPVGPPGTALLLSRPLARRQHMLSGPVPLALATLTTAVLSYLSCSRR